MNTYVSSFTKTYLKYLIKSYYFLHKIVHILPRFTHYWFVFLYNFIAIENMFFDSLKICMLAFKEESF